MHELIVTVISPGLPFVKTDNAIIRRGAVVQVHGLSESKKPEGTVITLHSSVSPKEYARTASAILGILTSSSISYTVRQPHR